MSGVSCLSRLPLFPGPKFGAWGEMPNTREYHGTIPKTLLIVQIMSLVVMPV